MIRKIIVLPTISDVLKYADGKRVGFPVSVSKHFRFGFSEEEVFKKLCPKFKSVLTESVGHGSFTFIRGGKTLFCAIFYQCGARFSFSGLRECLDSCLLTPTGPISLVLKGLEVTSSQLGVLDEIAMARREVEVCVYDVPRF